MRALFFTAGLLCCVGFFTEPAHARTIGQLESIPHEKLSDRNFSRLGTAALAIRASEWQHTETANFVCHYFQSAIAAPVCREAEDFYDFLARDLDRETAKWERKCHIFIFEHPGDWRTFQTSAQLDPWTGGIHSRGELFLLRNATYRWKGHTLAHEVAHLVIDRFFGAGVPLWINEGYAEYGGFRAYMVFFRRSGYTATGHSAVIAPADYIPLAQLTGMVSYPAGEKQTATFYAQSERLVRFLCAENKAAFVAFLDALSKGGRTETALTKAFGDRFRSLDALDQEFKKYAANPYREAR